MADQDEVTTHEQELAEYLQERIKPGLNRGSIPLLARSIAKEIARREHLSGGSDQPEADDEHDEPPEAELDDEPTAEADEESDEEADDASTADADEEPDDEPTAEADEEPDDEPTAEADEEPDDEPTAEADEEPDDESESPLDEFETEMHELQAELGDDWILRFSVQGDDAWLTAEKQDGSQHVEGPTAEVLLQAVELLDEGNGRTD